MCLFYKQIQILFRKPQIGCMKSLSSLLLLGTNIFLSYLQLEPTQMYDVYNYAISFIRICQLQ